MSQSRGRSARAGKLRGFFDFEYVFVLRISVRHDISSIEASATAFPANAVFGMGR